MEENRQYLQIYRGYGNVDKTKMKDGELALHKSEEMYRDTLIAYNQDNGLTAFPSLVSIQDNLNNYDKKKCLGSEFNPVAVASFQDNRLKLGASMLVDPSFPTRNAFMNSRLEDDRILFEIPQYTFSINGQNVNIRIDDAYQLIYLFFDGQKTYVPSTTNFVVQITSPNNNGAKNEVSAAYQNWNGDNGPLTINLPYFNADEGDKIRVYFTVKMSDIKTAINLRGRSIDRPFIIQSTSSTGCFYLVRNYTRNVHVSRGGLVYDTVSHSKTYPNKSQELTSLPYQLDVDDFIYMLYNLNYDIRWKTINRVGCRAHNGTKTFKNLMRWKRFLKHRNKFTQEMEKIFKASGLHQIQWTQGRGREFMDCVMTYLRKILIGGNKQIYSEESLDEVNKGKAVKRYIDFAIFETSPVKEREKGKYIKPKGAIYRLRAIWVPPYNGADGYFIMPTFLTYVGEINANSINKDAKQYYRTIY